MVAIFLRMGWSLGNVPHRYIKGGAASDKVLGRVLCGLNIHNEEFGALPPRLEGHLITEALLSEAVPDFARYPECFRVCIPLLIGSVVHHYPWLNANLPSDHVFWSSRFHRCRCYDILKDHIILGIGKCQSTGMLATGLTTHVISVLQNADMRRLLEALPNAVFRFNRKSREHCSKSFTKT